MGEINIDSKATSDTSSCDCSQFLGVMQLILDDEATDEQLCFFKEHMDGCSGCWEHYNVEKSVIDEIRTKLTRKCCPDSLKSSILDKIQTI